MLRISVICLSLILAWPAHAGSVEDSIVSQLRAQGFTSIQTSRTWLGRGRVRAQSPTLEREIVFNPVTGVILRDYSVPRAKSGRPRVHIVDPREDFMDKPTASARSSQDSGDEDHGQEDHGQDDRDAAGASDDGPGSHDSGSGDSGSGDSGSGDSGSGDSGSGDGHGGDSGGDD